MLGKEAFNCSGSDRADYSIVNIVFRTTPQVGWPDLIVPKPMIQSIDDHDPLDTDIIVIATGDTEIRTAAASIVGRIVRDKAVVLHTSGALSSSELVSLSNLGIRTGSIHPLISVSDPVRGADSFTGAYFCLEGDAEAVETARAIAENLGGIPFSIETRFKALYHAAAVLASGHVTTLFSSAAETLAHCGLAEDAALRALLPLLKSTVRNLSEDAPADALTGPFARADVEAIDRHLTAFEAAGLNVERRIYTDLGQIALRLSVRKGIDAGKAAEIQNTLKLALATAK